MFLEITTVGYSQCDDGTLQSEGNVFIGPFESDETRSLFREHWERQLNTDEHNRHQVKFLSCDVLPQGWGSIRPRDFRGFYRIPDDLDEVGGLEA